MLQNAVDISSKVERYYYVRFAIDLLSLSLSSFSISLEVQGRKYVPLLVESVKSVFLYKDWLLCKFVVNKFESPYANRSWKVLERDSKSSKDSTVRKFFQFSLSHPCSSIATQATNNQPRSKENLFTSFPRKLFTINIIKQSIFSMSERSYVNIEFSRIRRYDDSRMDLWKKNFWWRIIKNHLKNFRIHMWGVFRWIIERNHRPLYSCRR